MRTKSAGRKPLPTGQKKKQVTLYIEQDIIDSFQGVDYLTIWLNLKIKERQESLGFDKPG